MRHLSLLLALTTVFVCTGCHGPKSDCEGTLKSYGSIIDSNDWDDLPEIIWAPHRHKFGDTAIRNWIGNVYFGAKSFKFTNIDAQVTKDLCIAQASNTWHQKIRGKNPEDFDEVFTYTLHLVDGKWYMEVPGGAKVTGYIQLPPDE